ncbi:MAG: hypothetical protein ABIA37_02325 [Candidatus Woesearchaeota archaeon]
MGTMYPKRKNHIFMELEELETYTDEEGIDQRIEDGDLNPTEAAILRGNLRGNLYLEEEEE